MAEKNSFILYDNYFNQIQFLDMEQRGELLTAIFEYRNSGEIQTQLSQITQVVFSFIKDALERDAEAYKRRCDANHENGKKGGRPSKKTSVSKTKKPKKADNDNENDNENENDIDIGNGIGNGIENDGGSASLSSDGSADSVGSAGSACLRRLSEQEKEDLISFGIPSGYIEERRSRAEEYGREHGQSPMDVLLSWWREDEKRERRKPRASPEEKREVPKSYDLDEFFEAAIRRGICDLSATEGGEKTPT